MIFSVDNAASAVVSIVVEWLVDVLTSPYVEVSSDEVVLELIVRPVDEKWTVLVGTSNSVDIVSANRPAVDVSVVE